MWWTPDSKKLLYYRFDNTGVEPFHLVIAVTRQANLNLVFPIAGESMSKQPSAACPQRQPRHVGLLRDIRPDAIRRTIRLLAGPAQSQATDPLRRLNIARK